MMPIDLRYFYIRLPALDCGRIAASGPAIVLRFHACRYASAMSHRERGALTKTLRSWPPADSKEPGRLYIPPPPPTSLPLLLPLPPHPLPSTQLPLLPRHFCFLALTSSVHRWVSRSYRAVSFTVLPYISSLPRFSSRYKQAPTPSFVKRKINRSYLSFPKSAICFS